MVDRSAEIDYKMEAQERLIQEQQKTINEPKVLVMKVEENTQKTVEDKVGGSSLGESRSKEDEGKQIRGNEGVHFEEEDDSKFIFIDPHAEKIEKLQSQLEALIHKKRLEGSSNFKTLPNGV